jgi:hypothetical protein
MVEQENKWEIWALVAYTCKSSYSGSRDQEDHTLKPGQIVRKDPISTKPNTQKGGGVAQDIGSVFKPQ